MKINKKLLLFLIFLLVIIIRFYFIFQTDYFHNDAYLNKRYIENIAETGKSVFYDKLSYNGRDVLYSPVFHYILAFFKVFLPGDLVLKIIPTIFLSLLIFIIYFSARKLTNDDNLSIFVALMSGFIPIVFAGTLNRISIYSIILPILFYLVYLFMKFNDKGNINLFVFLIFLLTLLHASAFLFLMALIFYIVIIGTENLTITKLKKELILFSIFLILFVEFLIYKKAFLEYGMGVIWGNVPYQILTSYFNFSFLEFIYKIGVLPIILGFIGIIITFYKKIEDGFLLISIIFSTLLLLWFRLIDSAVGMMFLAIALIIISSVALKWFLVYLERTKFKKSRLVFYSILVILFIFTLVVPSYIDASNELKQIPNNYEILVLNWVKENSLPDISVLAPIEKGFLVEYIANRKSVIDKNFLLAPDTTERYRDIERIYSTKSEVEALEIIEKYNIDYILLLVEIELKYKGVNWLNDKHCFEQAFIGNPKVFKVIC